MCVEGGGGRGAAAYQATEPRGHPDRSAPTGASDITVTLIADVNPPLYTTTSCDFPSH